MTFRIIISFALALTLVACNKEEATLQLSITPSSLAIGSGETIDFKLDGRSDFLVFYSGLDGQTYDEYPNTTAESINMQQAETPSFSRLYNYHGTLTAVFVASSYGNWGDDSSSEIFSFDIEVTDNIVNLKSGTLKTAGLFGEEYAGVIDIENTTMIVTIPQGTNVSGLTTNITPASPRATIFLDGAPFASNSQLDFSAGSKIFTVKAPGGAEQDWEVVIDFE